jgi:hypothetical protein
MSSQGDRKCQCQCHHIAVQAAVHWSKRKFSPGAACLPARYPRRACLRRFNEALPYGICIILTDNGIQSGILLTHRKQDKYAEDRIWRGSLCVSRFSFLVSRSRAYTTCFSHPPPKAAMFITSGKYAKLHARIAAANISGWSM